MRTASTWVLVLLLASSVGAGDERPGIRWATDLESELARAGREGRPVLFAINALETESANQALGLRSYPSRPWGEATREYVCFVCNGGEHPGPDGTCARYGSPLPCTAHQRALVEVLRRIPRDADSGISPQHVILESDGDVAFRKAYYTGVVTPELLRRYLVRLSPGLAYELAGDQRAEQMDALDAASAEDASRQALAWIASGDPLAPIGVLRAIDFCYDPDKRLRLIETLGTTPTALAPALRIGIEEAGARPDDQPEEALAYARALLRVDRATATRLLARIAARTRDAALARRAFGLWRGSGPASELGAAERALYAEARILRGEQADVPTDDAPLIFHARLERARALRAEPVDAALPQDAADLAPGALRRALLALRPARVVADADRIRGWLRDRPEQRVRLAAALALLRAGLADDGRVVATIEAGLADPIEGPDTRREAIARLGEDPGWNDEQWRLLLEKAVGRAR